MLSQQQNPHAVSYSLQQQQLGSKEITSEGEADVKAFTIRQYVLASRQKSVLQSWPFPEKYLQMCLDRGLRNVLPPFGLYSNSVAETSHNGLLNLNSTSDQDYDDKNVKVFKSESPDDPLEQKKQNIIKHGDSGLCLREEGIISPSVCVNKSSQILSCSSKTSKFDKRRRRKGRCRKRSMVDILAVAKHCTLEEIHRINQFSYAATGNIIEGYCHQTAPLENDSKMVERDDYEVANVDVNLTCLR